VIAVGYSKAQESPVETCEISRCHPSNDYFFPVESLSENPKGNPHALLIETKTRMFAA
jgi:hypothetical protein